MLYKFHHPQLGTRLDEFLFFQFDLLPHFKTVHLGHLIAIHIMNLLYPFITNFFFLKVNTGKYQFCMSIYH